METVGRLFDGYAKVLYRCEICKIEYRKKEHALDCEKGCKEEADCANKDHKELVYYPECGSVEIIESCMCGENRCSAYINGDDALKQLYRMFDVLESKKRHKFLKALAGLITSFEQEK